MSLLLLFQSPAAGFTGSAAMQQTAGQTAATGSLNFQGQSATVNQAALSAASGSLNFSGTAQNQAGVAFSSATGQLAFIGTAAGTANASTTSATGSLNFQGSAGQIASAAISSATGGIGAITGNSALTANAATSQAAGQLGFAGAGVQQMEPGYAAAAGSLDFNGAGEIIDTPLSGFGDGVVSSPTRGTGGWRVLKKERIAPPTKQRITGYQASRIEPAESNASGQTLNPVVFAINAQAGISASFAAGLTIDPISGVSAFDGMSSIGVANGYATRGRAETELLSIFALLD